MIDYPKPMMDEEFEKLIAATPLAAGASREVFEVPTDPTVVVKRVKNGFPGPNITEWMIWLALVETEIEPLFGRCITISWSSRYLMIERLDDTDAQTLFPPVPYWLTDRKRSAFGLDKAGAVKIRDYATVKLGDILGRAHREKVIGLPSA